MDFCIQLENLKKIARMVGRQVCCLLVFLCLNVVCRESVSIAVVNGCRKVN